MAALTTAQKKAAWHAFLETTYPTATISWTKTDLELAVDTINSWVDANQVSMVAALNAGAPAFGGANSTATDKALLFVYVLLTRQGLL